MSVPEIRIFAPVQARCSAAFNARIFFTVFPLITTIFPPQQARLMTGHSIVPAYKCPETL